MRVDHDWGRYGHEITREGSDMLEANRRFNESLCEKGYRPAGGEALDGFGWASRRNRTDRLFPPASLCSGVKAAQRRRHVRGPGGRLGHAQNRSPMK
jgi:hypothetical protein